MAHARASARRADLPAAPLGSHHDADDLVERQGLCATDLGTVTVAGFESEALTLDVPEDDGTPVLVVPDQEAPVGGRLS